MRSNSGVFVLCRVTACLATILLLVAGRVLLAHAGQAPSPASAKLTVAVTVVAGRCVVAANQGTHDVRCVRTKSALPEPIVERRPSRRFPKYDRLIVQF